MDSAMATSAAGRTCGSYPLKSSSGNPFLDALPEPDPICKLYLRETSEFVGSLPMAARTSVHGGRGLLDISMNGRRDGANSAMQPRRAEPHAPCSPGRPIFGFSSTAGDNIGGHNNSGSSSGGSANHLLPQRRSFPSKWDNAEKWVTGPGSGSSHSSPAHPLLRTTSNSSVLRKQVLLLEAADEDATFAEKSRVTAEDVAVSKSKVVVPNSNGVSPLAAAEVILKDKFTDEVRAILPKFRCSDLSSKEGFLFGGTIWEPVKDKATDETHRRDIGTETTPLGSSTNSRCHTPFKSSCPARHNTPASRSGPLSLEDYQEGGGNVHIPTFDISQLNECHHLAKLQLMDGWRNNRYDSVASKWSSREEEEEEVSKSLRHFENANGGRISLQKSGSQTRAAAWEEDEQLKCCLRYQREEAKIQAWVNLESAKAEAQSRKLEVKIQKMRSKLEEKLMRRMAVVHRKAEEWKAEARQQHADQVDKTTEQAKKMSRHQGRHHGSCGCFP
ncbi:hypothetical protein MLD38_030790 [Melastoma candidum]|uniref:Uncharacterized protein n=1 Tax=Melastoma candidum TaxID=119954 RepID=A0ACB9MST8_9MYRT|nr:hypothetical protein MLD38_030790 [Melastoma candidum]